MIRGVIRSETRGNPIFGDDENKSNAKSKPASDNHVYDSASGANADIQPQNAKHARVYVFGEEDIGDVEAGMEMSELRSRGGVAGKQKSTNWSQTMSRDKEEVLEREIVEGDTLQSVALQFGCQVAELKRINNLIRDQEFFALKVLKVPIRRHGLLTELIAEENKKKNGPKLSLRPPNGTNDSIITVDDINYEGSDEEGDNPELQSLLVRTLSIRDVCNNPSKDAQAFLRSMDHDLEKIRKSTNSYKDSLEEVAKSLTCKRIYPIRKSSNFLNGADCGINWRTVVLLMVIIGLLVPLTYFLYYEFGKPPD